MRVLAEVYPSTLGRAMYRINKALKDYAPSWVEFTTDKDNNDLQILDIIGPGNMPYLYNKKNYVILQHCSYIENPENILWDDVWKASKLVASYIDFAPHAERVGFNFHRMPWGVDNKIFYRENSPKVYEVLTTGYVANTERIGEIAEAVYRRHKKMVNIGGGQARDELAKYMQNGTVEMFEGITDDNMRRFYCRSRFVGGMRENEGFELPILEGLLCGARGIVLDLPVYHYWYGSLVEYVKDDTLKHVTEQVYDILDTNKYRPVTLEEQEFVKDKFSWETIMTDFWKKVEESI